VSEKDAEEAMEYFGPIHFGALGPRYFFFVEVLHTDEKKHQDTPLPWLGSGRILLSLSAN